jgi:hypothetical protein
VGVKRADCRPFQQAVVVLPREQHLGGGACLHGQLGAYGNGVAQADGAFGGGHADPPVALAAEDLGALAGGIAQLHQHRAGGGDQTVLARGGRQLNQAAAEDETALDVAADQPVVHQGQGQPVDGGPGQSRGRHQLRQRGGPGLKRVKHMGRFINDTDSTRIVHVMILPSHYLRCKSFGWRIARVLLFQWISSAKQQ